MEGKPLTLYELNSLVRGVIESTLNAGYWVEAELSEAREVRGALLHGTHPEGTVLLHSCGTCFSQVLEEPLGCVTTQV